MRQLQQSSLGKYECHEVEIEGGREHQSGLFTKQALTLIHQASQGVFRTIGTIATNALLKVQIIGGSQVEAEHVQTILQR